MKKIFKISLIGISSLIATYVVVNIVACPIAFSILFAGNKSNDPVYTPGLIDYSQIKENYPRKEFKFHSKTSILNGFIYENDASNKVLIFAHGIKASSSDYLNIAMYFYDAGYTVFTYDAKGVNNDNDNALGGFPEGIISMEGALDYLKENGYLENKELYLLGHSWGAYSSLAVLNNTTHDIKGVASIAGFNSSEEEIINFARPYMSFFADLSSPFIHTYQRSIYPEHSSLTAIDGVNKYKNAKVFLGHGTNDEIFDINYSLLSKSNQMKTEHVVTYICDGINNGHNTILFSEDAVRYQVEVNDNINKIKEENNDQKLKEYIASIDDHKYSEVNNIMFDKIINLFA